TAQMVSTQAVDDDDNDIHAVIITSYHSAYDGRVILLRRSEFAIRNRSLSTIAAAAIVGFKTSLGPNHGTNNPIATGIAATLYPNAQIKFQIIVLNVSRLSVKACGSLFRSPRINVMSAVSISISVPVP